MTINCRSSTKFEVKNGVKNGDYSRFMVQLIKRTVKRIISACFIRIISSSLNALFFSLIIASWNWLVTRVSNYLMIRKNCYELNRILNISYKLQLKGTFTTSDTLCNAFNLVNLLPSNKVHKFGMRFKNHPEIILTSDSYYYKNQSPSSSIPLKNSLDKRKIHHCLKLWI